MHTSIVLYLIIVMLNVLLVMVNCAAANLRHIYCNVYDRISLLLLLFIAVFVLAAGHVVVAGAPDCLPQLTIYFSGRQQDMPATAKSLSVAGARLPLMPC
jgi:hypothetical protein